MEALNHSWGTGLLGFDNYNLVSIRAGKYLQVIQLRV